MNNNTKTLHFSNYRFNFKIFLHQLTLYGDNKIEKRAKISGLELNKPVFHFLLSFKLILKKKNPYRNKSYNTKLTNPYTNIK